MTDPDAEFLAECQRTAEMLCNSIAEVAASPTATPERRAEQAKFFTQEMRRVLPVLVRAAEVSGGIRALQCLEGRVQRRLADDAADADRHQLRVVN